MRIAFVTHSRRKVGGVQVYLDSVIPAVARAGHQVSCLYEEELPLADREYISIPHNSPTWSVETLGRDRALASLREWRPDVCFNHGIRDANLEASIVAMEASVLFVHDYYGTCISGQKTHDLSTPVPCERRFGAACLAQYYPQRCGGGNPLTMWQLYRRQSKRLELMTKYRALIATSEHIAHELSRYDLKAERVYCPVTTSTTPPAQPPSANDDEITLIFSGRMTELKGGQYLISALPEIQLRLQKRLRVLFAGDGPAHSQWTEQSNAIATDSISIEFRGWLDSSALAVHLTTSHLLVYPSVWPEPFGLSGLEAGLYGVPSVAFAVGGIPEWLHEGVNGHLAPVGVQSLADAIIRSLANPEHYSRLRAGACLRAHEFSLDRHLSELLPILERCAR
jgi:glycosyltransferase involved in cell wall biosynthesis